MKMLYRVYIQYVDNEIIYTTVYSEIFARILFSRIALKDIFATLKNSRLSHDLPSSVNDRMISLFCEG